MEQDLHASVCDRHLVADTAIGQHNSDEIQFLNFAGMKNLEVLIHSSVIRYDDNS